MRARSSKRPYYSKLPAVFQIFARRKEGAKGENIPGHFFFKDNSKLYQSTLTTTTTATATTTQDSPPPRSPPKFAGVRGFLAPLTAGRDIFLAEGPHWRR